MQVQMKRHGAIACNFSGVENVVRKALRRDKQTLYLAVCEELLGKLDHVLEDETIKNKAVSP